MALAPGAKLSKSIRLVRLLGRGGMGSVWVAEHEGLGREVAVKFVSEDLQKAGDQAVFARFSREAKLAARLDSPHVVRVFDHGETEEGVAFIVMELLRGQSLAERIAERGRLAPAAVADLLTQVARGLDHAHALSVVHRDIKPHNIFYAKTADGSEVVKIVDFGIAKSDAVTSPTTHSTESGLIVGTPQYMSPEQLMRAGPPDRGADVWALAVVAYEALTGRVPFAGETLAATLVAITRAEVRPPTKSVPDLPTGLDGFFRRAFSLEPARRFQTASELAQAFALAMETAVADTVEPSPLSARSLGELPTGEFLALGKSEQAGEQPLGFAATEPGVVRPSVAPTKPSASPRPAGRGRLAVWVAVAGALAVASVAYLSTRTPAAPDGETTPRPATSSEGSAAAQTEPSSAPSAAPSISIAEPRPRIGTIARTQIKDGMAPQSALYVAAFELAHEDGDGGATLHSAAERCERKGLSLCTEAQWTAACAALPELGREPSWTITPADDGVVVRGGPACDARSTAKPASTDPARVGVCCSRAVGTSTSGSNKAFLATTGGKLLAYEEALDTGDTSRLIAMSEPTVEFHGKTLSSEELGKTALWISKNSTLRLDSCKVSISDRRNADDQVERTWSADCVGLLTTPTKAAKVARRLTFGDGGLLEEVREPKSPTPL
jgi:serine/threonine-protein kinase